MLKIALVSERYAFACQLLLIYTCVENVLVLTAFVDFSWQSGLQQYLLNRPELTFQEKAKRSHTFYHTTSSIKDKQKPIRPVNFRS